MSEIEKIEIDTLKKAVVDLQKEINEIKNVLDFWSLTPLTRVAPPDKEYKVTPFVGMGW